MNTVLLPAAAPNNSATIKTGTSRQASDHNAPEQASDFAGVLASQATPPPQGNNTAGAADTNPQTRGQVHTHADQGTARNPQHSDAGNHHDAARNQASGRLTLANHVLTDLHAHHIDDAASAPLRTTHGADPATDAKAGLPGRFTQIIAAMAKVNGPASGAHGAPQAGTGKPDMPADPDMALTDRNGKHYTTHSGGHQHTHTARTTSRPGFTVDVDVTAARDTLTTGMPAVGSDPTAFNLSETHNRQAEHSPLHALQGAAPMAADTSGSPSITPAAALSLIPSSSQGGDITIQSATINQPLHTQQWAPELGRQFISLVRTGENGSHIAELRLDPPELGPLRVTINLNDSIVQALFTSSHASVRSAVENALPQLQQHLEQEGLSLGHASVDHDDGSPDTHPRHGSAGTTDNHGEISVTTTTSPVRQRAPDALVDTFA